MKRIITDIAVIGAGSGGLSVAAGAVQLGQRVVLFEKGEMGGDCLNSGCVPSKALIAAARAVAQQRAAARFGVASNDPPADWAAVKAHIKSVIATIAPIDSQERFEKLGVTVIREAARFDSEYTLISDSVIVEPNRIVIATGSRPTIPPIHGLSDVPFYTNETIFDAPELPDRLIILGGGPIGIELGQALRRLGSKIVIIEARRALGRADAEAAAIAIARLRAEGVAVMEGRTAVRARVGASGTITITLDDGTPVEGSHLMVALGRTPIYDGLDLAKGDVALDEKGLIRIKPNLRSVSNHRVWVVGDATGQTPFTHAAGWHASVVVRNALFKAPTRADSLPMPGITYCDPEVGQIGLTEAEAKAALGERKVKTARWDFHDNDRAQAERSTEGFLKIVTTPGGKILGASMVGDGAGDVLQIVAVAMSNKLPIRALTNYIAPYPTRGEIVKRVAGQWYAPTVFSMRAKALVRVLSSIP